MDSTKIPQLEKFSDRHIGPRCHEWNDMAVACGSTSLDELMKEVIPSHLLRRKSMKLPQALSEVEALAELKSLAGENQVFRSLLGLGYFDCVVPTVIQRNVLENPGWYTQYTPYQAEIAQGRLEALLNFQTMITELTGMEIANASLLDEATAAAEAMAMLYARRTRKKANVLLVDQCVLPQTLAVLQTRAEPLGIIVETGALQHVPHSELCFAALLSSPGADGQVVDLSRIIPSLQQSGIRTIVATDLMALALIQSPGSLGADVVVGSAQRFGVPLGFGGPHAAFFATRDEFKRSMPGRLVGVSRDASGNAAYRLTLQTREQHIRREKATSNICTAQVLLAIMASMYAVYHGPSGLRRIAARIHNRSLQLAHSLEHLGYSIVHDTYFDTLAISLKGKGVSVAEIVALAAKQKINLRSSVLDPEVVVIALDERSNEAEVRQLIQLFGGESHPVSDWVDCIPASQYRSDNFMAQEVFHSVRSETEMLRYLKKLESRDLSLAQSMIPLGSCTMKLNATSEMVPVSWPEWNALHPMAPQDQWAGYARLFSDLECWLAEITGFDGVSLQPNAGSQGEFAGLLVIREYFKSRGEGNRTICLIPASAHGTNPASAVMAGMQVVPVACDDHGNINESDLLQKVQNHAGNLAALMITYPSTHGVFEESVIRICDLIHQHGGQVYMDGANLNAQVGLCAPADLGADVCHINLHKTFCIPHGGGGPGMGPIAVASHLVPFLPGHPFLKSEKSPLGPVAAAPYSSASILVISWMYIRMMGTDGLTDATRVAILNANYMASMLHEFYPVLYKGKLGRVAHECILDLRHFKNVSVEDIAKRLMDYGFHAPTVSWPVLNTVMIEPTESESRQELDRFCQAMISIRKEIEAIENGQMEPSQSPLKNAPHTAASVMADEWKFPYSRSTAAYPAPWVESNKFWPAVGRIDNVFGDRNPICTCPSVEELSQADIHSLVQS